MFIPLLLSSSSAGLLYISINRRVLVFIDHKNTVLFRWLISNKWIKGGGSSIERSINGFNTLYSTLFCSAANKIYDQGAHKPGRSSWNPIHRPNHMLWQSIHWTLSCHWPLTVGLNPNSNQLFHQFKARHKFKRKPPSSNSLNSLESTWKSFQTIKWFILCLKGTLTHGMVG